MYKKVCTHGQVNNAALLDFAFYFCWPYLDGLYICTAYYFLSTSYVGVTVWWISTTIACMVLNNSQFWRYAFTACMISGVYACVYSLSV